MRHITVINKLVAVAIAVTCISLGLVHFDTTRFTANIATQAVPEPISIFGSGLALGFGGFLKRKYSKST